MKKRKASKGKYSFLKEVLDEVTPDNSVYKNVNEMLSKINAKIKKFRLKAVAVAGGSIAKGNFIKGDHDIDLFVKFNKKYPSEKLSEHLAKLLSGMNAERIHGSRDYFRIRNEHNFEIVPVIDIKKGDESKNVTDMSPLHVKWVKSKTSKNPRLNDEIRLTKQFCKAQHVYGAESYIRGFSGHVIDIVVIYYGSFLKLVQNAANWKEKQVIDYHNFHKGKALFNLNVSKIGPLNVIDPVMPIRNASAALSLEKFRGFVDACRNFVKKPSRDFFVRHEISMQMISAKHKGKKVVQFNVELAEGKEDVVGAKMVRALDYFSQQAEKNDFKVVDKVWSWDRKRHATFYFVLADDVLPSKKLVYGPPLDAKEHVARFKKAHRKWLMKGKKLMAEDKRKYVKFTDFILGFAKNGFFSDKIKSIA